MKRRTSRAKSTKKTPQKPKTSSRAKPKKQGSIGHKLKNLDTLAPKNRSSKLEKVWVTIFNCKWLA